MKYSVVIPAYNEQERIRACIESVHREFRTSEYEVIVVDNGSTDLTAAVAEDAGCVVVHEPRKGVTRARQAGLKASKGYRIAFIDADNILPSGWLYEVEESLYKINVVCVSGPVVYYEMPLHKRLVTSAFYFVAKLLHYALPMVQGGNFVVKSWAMEAVGGFDTDIDFYGEDTDTAVRLSKIGNIEFNLGSYCYSSARRLEGEGLIVTGSRYIINYFWMWAFKKPFTLQHNDIRPKIL